MLGRSPPLNLQPPGAQNFQPPAGAVFQPIAPPPPRPPGNEPPPGGEPSRNEPARNDHPRNDHPRRPRDNERDQEDDDSHKHCKLPHYWSCNPTLWFAQVEAAFASSGIFRDHKRYNLLVAALPPEVAQEISDIILSPPANDRYETVKLTVLQRLADSTELQLHKLLNEVRLDDRTPSQLLRHMRRLGGAAITDEALKAKWLDLLPPYASRMCRVLSATSLDELAILADKLTSQEPSVNAVNRRSSPSPTPSSGISSGTSTPAEVDPLTTLNNNVVQLVEMMSKQATTLQAVARALNTGSQNNRSRSTTRASSRRRRSPSPAAGSANPNWCWYHRKHGRDAEQCKPPCSFPAQEN